MLKVLSIISLEADSSYDDPESVEHRGGTKEC